MRGLVYSKNGSGYRQPPLYGTQAQKFQTTFRGRQARKDSSWPTQGVPKDSPPKYLLKCVTQFLKAGCKHGKGVIVMGADRLVKKTDMAPALKLRR